MKCLIYIYLSVFLFSAQLSAQNKVRGLSQPGSLMKKKDVIIEPGKKFGIFCDISFTEPSEDNMLSEGETGVVKVDVKNLTDKPINPKLTISLKARWSSKPRTTSKWMDVIQAGETGTYSSTMKWDERLPSGSIVYEAKVVDTNSNIESEAVEVGFGLLGKGNRIEAPVFVDVDKNIPKIPVQNIDAIAVVIGNSDYVNPDVPDVEFALNDARIMKKYLLDVLGYREGNIIYIENAKKSDLNLYFGTSDIYQGKLYNYVKPNISDVFVYYSGHGAPDVQGKKAYLMPTDADPNYVQLNGYPLDLLYKNLEKIPAKSKTIVLDACFSGGSQQGMIIKNASPMYIDVKTPLIGENLNLLSSSEGDQISSWYPEGKHSLFTYYVLRALRGEADSDKNRSITLGELKKFLSDQVTYMARRKYGREQTPIVRGDLSSVICSY
jgi:hypothetical protein